MAKADIVGMGMAVVDAVALMDGYPQEDTKLLAQESFQQGGGPCATALVAASRLGVASAYMGVVARDIYGDYVMDEFARYGVDTGSVRRVEGDTPRSLVLLNGQNGSCTIVWHEGCVPPAGVQDIDEETLAAAKILHLDNHEMAAATEAAQRAKALGVRVSLDAGSVYPGCEELLRLADILVPSERFVRQWSGTDDALTGARRLAEAYQPELLAVTLGPRGVLHWRWDGFVQLPAYKVTAVDTNGAGDVFHGALLAALVRGLSHGDALRFAMAAAAMKCQKLGARAGMPGWDDVDRFVKAYPQ